MADHYYPKVTLDFIIECAKQSEKLEEGGIIKVGSTISLVLAGPQPVFKRTIVIRAIEGEITFENATNLAVRLGFMGKLLAWYEEHKNWKDGEYRVA